MREPQSVERAKAKFYICSACQQQTAPTGNSGINDKKMDTFPPCSKKRGKKSRLFFTPPTKKIVSLQDIFIIGAYDKVIKPHACIF